MGVMRFQVIPPSRLSAEDAQRAYLAGPDLSPWRSRVTQQGDVLTIERAVGESGNLHVPWNVAGHDALMLTTATLIERERPYNLAVELARGTLNRARLQLAEWQGLGLHAPESLLKKIETAGRQLAQAATAQDPILAAERADAALRTALDAAGLLAACYTEQALPARRQLLGDVDLLLGVRVTALGLDDKPASRLPQSFNAALVPISWRETESAQGACDWSDADARLEWCRARGLKVIGGPLLRLDGNGLPDWLALWQGQGERLIELAVNYARQAVTRYRGRVAAWHCAGRINLPGAFRLREEERLRLAVQLVETVRRIDPQTPAVLCFDQPWAEYMARQEPSLTPFEFADAMVRAGLGLTGIGLEFNFGYDPGGTFPRDLLAVSRLIDLWSLLGLPLHVILCVPSGEGPDPAAQGRMRPLAGAAQGGWSEQHQQWAVERLVPLLLAKPAVQAIVWNELSDGLPHELPHGGVYAADGRAKPSLAAFAGVRREVR